MSSLLGDANVGTCRVIVTERRQKRKGKMMRMVIRGHVQQLDTNAFKFIASIFFCLIYERISLDATDANDIDRQTSL